MTVPYIILGKDLELDSPSAQIDYAEGSFQLYTMFGPLATEQVSSLTWLASSNDVNELVKKVKATHSYIRLTPRARDRIRVYEIELTESIHEVEEGICPPARKTMRSTPRTTRASKSVPTAASRDSMLEAVRDLKEISNGARMAGMKIAKKRGGRNYTIDPSKDPSSKFKDADVLGETGAPSGYTAMPVAFNICKGDSCRATVTITDGEISLEFNGPAPAEGSQEFKDVVNAAGLAAGFTVAAVNEDIGIPLGMAGVTSTCDTNGPASALAVSAPEVTRNEPTCCPCYVPLMGSNLPEVTSKVREMGGKLAYNASSSAHRDGVGKLLPREVLFTFPNSSLCCAFSNWYNEQKFPDAHGDSLWMLCCEAQLAESDKIGGREARSKKIGEPGALSSVTGESILGRITAFLESGPCHLQSKGAYKPRKIGKKGAMSRVSR